MPSRWKALVIGSYDFRKVCKTQLICMKLFKKIIAFANKLIVCLRFKNVHTKGSELLMVRTEVSSGNTLEFWDSDIVKSRVTISGIGSIVTLNGALMQRSSIRIEGKNSRVEFEPGVKFRDSTIILRGDSLTVKIRRNSTTGGVRIVNVGQSCDVVIGENCMLSDNVEIWASDTHKIFDRNGVWINRESSVEIQDNVWVGSHVKILKGVKVGKGAILGMGSLVTKDIEEATLNVGAPSKAIKRDLRWTNSYTDDL